MGTVNAPPSNEVIEYMKVRLAHFESLLERVKAGTVLVPAYEERELKFIRPDGEKYESCRARYQSEVEQDLTLHQQWFANGMPHAVWVEDTDRGST